MRTHVIRVAGGSLALLGAGLLLVACGSGTNAASSVHNNTTPATGAQATLAGTQTSTPPASANAVYVAQFDPSAPPVRKPAELEFYEHTEMQGIVWSSWDGNTARGKGVLADNGCVPDCASGTYTKYAAEVVLSDVKLVGGRPEYTRYTVTFVGQDQHSELAKALTNQPINAR